MLNKNQLQHLELFEGIAPQTIEKLLLSGKVLEVSKGTVVMRAKEPISQVLFQLSGKSILYNLTHAGKRKILFVMGKGALLNDHIFNDQTPSVYCEVIDRSCILAVPARDLMRMMTEDSVLMKNILEAQEKKIWRLSHQLKNTMSSIYLERKLASKLWKLGRDFGIPAENGIEIDMNLSITFLADMLGAPRETTSRVFAELVEYGLIKANKKRVVILDKDKMLTFYKTGKID